MTTETITMDVIGHVVGGRVEPTDDFWGGTEAIIRLDKTIFTPESVLGIDAFSHLEVVFHFHKTDLADLDLGARRPRNNPAWPLVGNLAHRNMRKINRIGLSRCELVAVDGLDLHVRSLDAIDGTPVLEIKPYFEQFGPQGEVVQPVWVGEMLGDYYAAAQGAAAES